jgi:hypothetical protein
MNKQKENREEKKSGNSKKGTEKRKRKLTSKV